MAFKQNYGQRNSSTSLYRVQTKTDARLQDEGNDKGIKDCIKELKLQIEQMNLKLQNLESMVQEKCDKNSKNILKAFNGLSEVLHKANEKIQEVEVCTKKLDGKINQADLKAKEVDKLAFKLQNEISMIQYRSMENALRLRGIPERPKENLIQKCSKALAKLLEIKEDEIIQKFLKTYRVNSWIAKQRNLPRDVVVCLTDINMRNDIAARSFSSKVYIEGKQIIVFKEIPSRILRLRKEFRFLAVELKKRAVLFRWDAPVGMSFTYGGQCYKLNTIEKAKAFYSDVLEAGNLSSSSRLVPAPIEEEKLEVNLECLQELEEKPADQDGEKVIEQPGLSDEEEFLEETKSGASDGEELSNEIQPGILDGEEFLSEIKFKRRPYKQIKNWRQYMKPRRYWQHTSGS